MQPSLLTRALAECYWYGWCYSKISQVFNITFVRFNLLIDLFGRLANPRIKIQHLSYSAPEEMGIPLFSVQLSNQILELFGVERKVLKVIEF